MFSPIGDTVITRYTSSSTSETWIITPSTVPPLTIDVAADSPCELMADKNILVSMVINNHVVDQGRCHSIVALLFLDIILGHQINEHL